MLFVVHFHYYLAFVRMQYFKIVLHIQALRKHHASIAIFKRGKNGYV